MRLGWFDGGALHRDSHDAGSVSIAARFGEDLMGEAPKPGKRGPAPKLQQQLEQLQALPRAKQRLVSEVLDSLLAQAGR